MAVLKTKADVNLGDNRASRRIFPVTTKLTREECKAVTDFARSQGSARGQWIRDVILGELRSGSKNDPFLAEILGIRILLVNVLRPLVAGKRLAPEAFDKLLDEIASAKHDLAARIVAEGRK